MQSNTLTLKELCSRAISVVRHKGLVLLVWGVVAFLLCLPCAMLFAHKLYLGGVQVTPFDMWESATALGRLEMVFSAWFMSFVLLGLTQAVATVATFDYCQDQATSMGKTIRLILPRLHRILALQLFVILLFPFLFLLSLFAIPAILFDGKRMFKAFRRSAYLLFTKVGKAILSLLPAAVIAYAWTVAVVHPLSRGPIANPFFATLLLEARGPAIYFLGGVIIGIPTALLYYQNREASQDAVG